MYKIHWSRLKLFSVAAGFESGRYLIKWLFLSSLIGSVAGASAILFTYSIDLVTHLSLGQFAHYLPPSPAGEGTTGMMPIGRWWALPLITALGGLLSGIIVFALAPEAEGHGTDAAIDAIHHKRARIRPRIPPIKLIASAITIGTGGSGGREGPTAQMSAGFGSILSDWFGLNVQDRRIAVCVGIGSGIGAIFRAPLGGAVMAAEILYIHDLEVEALIPSLMASIVGYSIYGSFYGWTPIFGELYGLGFNHPVQLAYYAILGLLCGLGGLLYSGLYYKSVQLFRRLSWPKWIKPAFAGLLVGLLGLVLPQALHTGYGWVQISMGPGLLNMPLWVVLVLPLAKIVATSLSIGSGGSGGIFGPGMVIGGMLGASFWRLTHGWLPEMAPEPGSFVIIGMMSLFGGIAHAPLAVMLMVAEMTGNLSLLAPAMVAVAISTALVGDHTIYRSQLRTRAESPAHRLQLSFPLLSSLTVREAMVPEPGPIIQADAPISAARAVLAGAGADAAVVVGDRQEVLGVLTARVANELEDGASIAQAVEKVVFEPDQTLEIALDRLGARGLTFAPVAEAKKLVGRISVQQVMQTYRRSLEQSIQRVGSLPPDTRVFETTIENTSALAGKRLRDAGLPPHVLVLSVNRHGKQIVPDGDTEILEGDVVFLTTSPENEPSLQSYLNRA